MKIVMFNLEKDKTSPEDRDEKKTDEHFGLDNHLYIQTVFVYNKCQRMSTVDTDKTINGVSRFVCLRVYAYFFSANESISPNFLSLSIKENKISMR